VQRLNTHNRFRVLPWQTPGLLEEANLTEQQVTDAAWFVDADGRKYRGAAAINSALHALGGIFRVASWVYRVPGFTQIEDWVYAWVARNRYRMPGSTEACQIPQNAPQTERKAEG
jgi:predicted DCC family thiol-disulfide oxidoreductase YuxK